MKGLAVILLSLVAVSCNKYGRRTTNRISNHPKCTLGNSGDFVMFRDDRDCGKFYECHRGTAFEFVCSEGQSFDLASRSCECSSIVDCSDGGISGSQDQPTPASVSASMPQARSTCNICRQAKESIPRHQNCPRTNGYYPVYFRNSKDCSQYYQCDQGTAYLIQCPAGLHFNTRSNVCDYPQNVDCSGPVLVSPTYPSSSSGEGRTSPSCPICQHARNVIPKHPNCPRSNGYYPAYFRHPTDCSTFYQCDNGSAYEIQCPAGLHFNTLLSVCDYPAKAGCSPIQESTSHTNGHQGSDGAAFPTNGHQGSDGSAFRTNGHQGFDDSASRTNGHQGSEGSVSRTNGHQGSDGSAFRTNGHQGFDDSASRTNGHQGSDGSVSRTNGHQGSDGSVSRTNGHQGSDGSVSRTNGHQGSDGAAFPTNGHQGFEGSVSRTNGHQGFDGSAFRTNGHQGSDGSTFRTNGHQGSGGSVSRTNGHQGSDGSAFRTNGHQGFDGSASRTNGHQGFDGSASRTNGHQGFDGSASRTNGHQGSDGSAFRTNGHQGFDGSVSRTNGHQGSDGAAFPTYGHQGSDGSVSHTNGHQGAVGSGSQSNGHQRTDVGTSKIPTDDNEIHPQCPIITGKQVANYWANPRDCTKYYGCLWGCVEELSCPGGYRWHDGKKACVEKRLVRC